jgi:hypothetical protein
MLPINERLTDHELQYIKVSQVWFNLLVQLCFNHSNVTDWKIGGWNVDIINLFISTLSYHETVTPADIEDDVQGAKALDEEMILKKFKTIKTLIRWQPEIGIGAGNDRLKKYIAIIDASPHWGANYAYLDRWDIDYLNAPKLNFVANFNEASLREFEQLFIKFLAINNEGELSAFGAYLTQQYPNK